LSGIGCDGTCEKGGSSEVPSQAAGAVAPDPRAAAVSEARDRAIERLLRERELAPTELWLLSKVVASSNHIGLATRMAHWKAGLRRDKPEKLAILDPTVPRPILPEEPGEGIKRLGNLTRAGYADPADRALAFLRELVTEPADQYMSTIQLITLVQWEEHRGALPPDLAEERKSLVARMLEHQLAEAGFSGLFVRRAFLLSKYGDACAEHMALWADVIGDAQQADGLWGEAEETISYGGRSWSAASETSPAAFAVAALQAYLDTATRPGRRCER
jgi:hypothetical protein